MFQICVYFHPLKSIDGTQGCSYFSGWLTPFSQHHFDSDILFNMLDRHHQIGGIHHGNLRRYATYWQFVTFAAMTFVAFVTPIQANDGCIFFAGLEGGCALESYYAYDILWVSMDYGLCNGLWIIISTPTNRIIYVSMDWLELFFLIREHFHVLVANPVVSG